MEWATRHASSNLELARLSNVNRNWRHIVVRVILEQVENESLQMSLLLLPSMVRSMWNKTDEERDTFCAAWFPPEGIQIQQLPVPGELWEDGEETQFAPSGVPFYAGSDEERMGRRTVRSPPRSRSRTRYRQREGPLCSHEWQGYRNPMDVLEPFEYAAAFVEVSSDCLF